MVDGRRTPPCSSRTLLSFATVARLHAAAPAHLVHQGVAYRVCRTYVPDAFIALTPCYLPVQLATWCSCFEQSRTSWHTDVALTT